MEERRIARELVIATDFDGNLMGSAAHGIDVRSKRKSDSIDDRVLFLEEQLQRTQDTLRSLVKKIEELHTLDVDGDGVIGK
jgi:hypothetical protein